VPRNLILGILLVKSVIWSVSLGSGASGGVLAPLLMMGGALGGMEAMFLPHEGVGFWPLVSMGAILGGTKRSPFTGVIFALELTHDVNMLTPLLLAVMIAHGFTVLTLKRSILTEKVARRGYHLSREYSVDPLEILFVREVMRNNIAALPADSQHQLAVEAIGKRAERIGGQRTDDVHRHEHHSHGVAPGLLAGFAHVPEDGRVLHPAAGSSGKDADGRRCVLHAAVVEQPHDESIQFPALFLPWPGENRSTTPR
jgi:hypothetical protein